MNALEQFLEWLGKTGRSPKLLREARAELARKDAIEKAARELIEYRKKNVLNFQLEKADDFIREMERNLR